MGQSNQVDPLKLFQKITLMQNCEFCEDMSKSKKIKSCIKSDIPLIKCLIFLCFWVELCKSPENDGPEIKISTRMKKFNFWVKFTVFIKNENEFLKNSDFCYTWSKDHIQWVFQTSERSDQYSRRYDILKLHTMEVTLFCIETIQHNAIPKRIRI